MFDLTKDLGSLNKIVRLDQVNFFLGVVKLCDIYQRTPKKVD